MTRLLLLAFAAACAWLVAALVVRLAFPRSAIPAAWREPEDGVQPADERTVILWQRWSTAA